MPVIQTNSDVASERADAVAALSAARALLQAAQAIIGNQSELGKALAGAMSPEQVQDILDLAPGSDVLAYSDRLQAFADLSADENQIAYFTGTDTLTLAAFPAFARSFLASASAGNAKELLALAIGDVIGLQTALNGKATPADIAAALATLTAGSPAELDTFLEAYNRFLSDESALSALTAIVAGKQAQDADLDAIASQGTAVYGRSLLLLANAAALTAAVNAFLGDTGTGGSKGLVPAPAAGDAAALKFLRADGTWATTPGGGVSSTGTVVAGRVPAYTDTTGKILADSGYAFTAAAADVRANAAGKAVSAAALWAAEAFVTLTDAATIAVDLSALLNAKVTLAGNRTLGTPTNAKEGQSGYIQIIQDGTGSRTLAYATGWDFGSAGTPTLSTGAGKIDGISYVVTNATGPVVHAFFRKAA